MIYYVIVLICMLFARYICDIVCHLVLIPFLSLLFSSHLLSSSSLLCRLAVRDQDQVATEHSRALQLEQQQLAELHVRLSTARDAHQTALEQRSSMTFMERVLEREAREETERARAASRQAAKVLQGLQAEAQDMRERVQAARIKVRHRERDREGDIRDTYMCIYI